ncbi:helix-hairpin-helix domain-containing protein [Streptomyces radicis]|uniref:DNA polymerase beta n=1 Tax=Streptomyces radicis TaxID=1750517 RepID=A0A3A9VZR0_9ACTN|nr:helix-hairpin-helix domain-containing protein [Streptomyces radicis]RKN06471.1 PHP domain-containing protein [Streptomyces radicis]RKN20270.1 PHP domain-containing protein [Streptomyces radicis]
MARPNDEVDALLREYADLIAITGGDAFKQRAYEKAARAIRGHPRDIGGLDAAGLRDIPGVGASIADKVEEYLRTGRVQAFDATRAAVPPGVRRLMSIPSLGPKKAMTLYRERGITGVDELVEAINAGRLSGLSGFGPRTREKILRGVAVARETGGRMLLDAAHDLADEAAQGLVAAGCERATWAGALRRMRETVGSVDLVAAARDPGPVLEAFTALPFAARTVEVGRVRAAVATAGGQRVTVRVVAPDGWGAGLAHATGARAHVAALRERAARRGLRFAPDGLVDVDAGERVATATEEELYAALGLDWVPPTLRENRGEIDAAAEGALPALVTEDALRGDLHTHTDLTDGLAPLAAMVEAAAARGYAYLAVTDHAPRLRMQRMTEEKILAQREELRALERGMGGRGAGGMRLLHGTELNIDPDGGVDWPDAFLAGFDLCVASIHSHFGLDRAAQTRRLIRACENPHVQVIGHPTTRKIGLRGRIDADLDAVFAACARTGTALEINGHPNRLDLHDEHVMRARRHGVRFALDSDAHSTRELANVRWSAATAQRAWLPAAEVINTWPLARLRRFLGRDAERP